MEVEEAGKEDMKQDGPNEGSSTNSRPSSTPRKRSAPPGMIPHFPSSTVPRDPPNQVSPSQSSTMSPPPARSPMSSPPSATASNTLSMPSFSFGSAAQSPWHFLAASSGAPTPSLESGPGMGGGRTNSPQLGYPFERLNIGGSWSGANLWGDAGQSGASDSTSVQTSSGSSAATPFSLNLPPPQISAARPSSGHKGKEKETSAPTAPPAKPTLPASLARRRASLPKNLFGALAGPSPLSTSTSTSTSTSPAPGTRLRPLSTIDLKSLLSASSTLILDLRPPSLFQASHLPASHSLPVPSTLLRRPAFTMERVLQMLSPSSQDAVSQWREKSDIILLDAESSSAPPASTLDGLANKFVSEGFAGNLWFVRGGHHAAKAANVRLVEGGSAEEEGASSAGFMVGRLDKFAFMQGSTGSSLQNQPAGTSEGTAREDPFSGRSSSQTEKPLVDKLSLNIKGTASEGSSTDKQKSQSSGDARSSASGGTGRPSRHLKMQPANPFFDNIRQNLELSHGGGRIERVSLGLKNGTKDRAEDLPAWLRELTLMGDDQSAERLAEEFYQVELGEQKRLQAVMDFHSKSSSVVGIKDVSMDGLTGDDPEYFPFSITAGVERGTKNRYKNIWPYDFSRVKIESPPSDDGCDYINASFVQPKGTCRRYIATQGPLDTTYRDFWLLVWEQGVRVIVMLTKQFEGGSVKCGNYWQDQDYGSIHIRLEAQSGGEEEKAPNAASSGFDFGPAARNPEDEKNAAAGNIRRVFSIYRDDKPDEPPRKVVHIQCTSWPDFDVPDSPEILLDLMEDVDQASEEMATATTEEKADQPPVLVHCSAGVGRTGSFIIVDAMVDALRQERHPELNNSSRVTQAGPSDDSASRPAHHRLHSTVLQSLTNPHPISPLPRTNSHESQPGASPGDAGVRNESNASGDSSRSVSFHLPGQTPPAPIPGRDDDGNADSAYPPVFAPSSLGNSTDSVSVYSGRSGRSAASSGSVGSSMSGRSGLSMLSNGSLEGSKDVKAFKLKLPSRKRSILSPDGSKLMDITSKTKPDTMDIDPIPHQNIEARINRASTRGSISQPKPTVLPPIQEKRSPLLDPEASHGTTNGAFRHYRGSSVVSVDSDYGDQFKRRPSITTTSGHSSSELLPSSLSSVPTWSGDTGSHTVITKSGDRHRTPSPIDTSSGLSPIAVVLQGMRVQRMSLVQSLRQYAFVHRAIIQSYLNMVDDDRKNGRDFAPNTHNPASADEETPFKRRASPTELIPENAAIQIDQAETGNSSSESEGSSLSKRPSFKKMRPDMNAILTESSDATSSTTN